MHNEQKNAKPQEQAAITVREKKIVFFRLKLTRMTHTYTEKCCKIHTNNKCVCFGSLRAFSTLAISSESAENPWNRANEHRNVCIYIFQKKVYNTNT